MLPGATPLFDHVRDAEGDDARLARARAGQDQHRAANGFDGLALLRVETGQIQHRARSLICHRGNASAQGENVINREYLRVRSGVLKASGRHSGNGSP